MPLQTRVETHKRVNMFGQTKNSAHFKMNSLFADCSYKIKHLFNFLPKGEKNVYLVNTKEMNVHRNLHGQFTETPKKN